MSDESVIEPAARRVLALGREIEVSPLRVGQLPKFAATVRPLSGAMMGLLDSFGPEQFLDLLADHGDAIIDAVSIGARVPRTDLEDADPADLLALALAVVKVNADFFGRRLLPVVAAMRQATAAGDGQTPSTP